MEKFKFICLGWVIVYFCNNYEEGRYDYIDWFMLLGFMFRVMDEINRVLYYSGKVIF